jgi:hypothetical protein
LSTRTRSRQRSTHALIVRRDFLALGLAAAIPAHAKDRCIQAGAITIP